MTSFEHLFLKLRSNLWLELFTINLRFLIGFGFIPSGLKKILSHPFANPGQEGAFFEYLDALYATGFYYEFIGWMQVIAAVLLITQRFAILGAFIFLPIIGNIMVFTLSTIGTLTPLIATLMFIGTLYLLVWDYPKWISILFSNNNHYAPQFISTLKETPVFWVKTGTITLSVPFLIILTFKSFDLLSDQKFIQIMGLGIVFLLPIIPLLANVIFIFRYLRSRRKEN